ncbi:MAG TPA: choice-of-anchor Q domain-containing protein [Solirubrobacteraceae bacterium]|jgi:CSLREA domain-containing protein|nr:choice-of-anchor Q domain-containing protein [Solirubrobacteraceae bacterium]
MVLAKGKSRSRGGLVTALTLLALLAFVASAGATSFTVNTPNDTTVGTAGCGSGQSCSLREAVAASSAGDTIEVPALPSNEVYTLQYGPLMIAHPLSIEGDGGITTIVHSTDGPIFQLCAAYSSGDVCGTTLTGQVTISGLGLSGGNSTASNGGGPGGAVENYGAALTLSQDEILNSEACAGGGVANIEGGTLNVDQTLIDNDTTDCSPYEGGAIFNDGTLNVVNSTISDNSSSEAGGIYVLKGQEQDTIANSTIAFNDSVPTGGGGAIGGGGGLDLQGGTNTVQDTILAYNESQSSSDPNPEPLNCSGFNASLGDNVETGTDCAFTASGDQQNTDPMLSYPSFTGLGPPPQDNGGPTDSFELDPNSPAIDTGGNACAGATVDQRGVQRGAPCDVGAVESPKPPQNSAPPTIYGNAAAGQTLTCTNGTWLDPDITPLSYTYAWQEGGNQIATGSTYAVQSADQGQSLTCSVTASNGAGSPVTVGSAPVTVSFAAPTSVTFSISPDPDPILSRQSIAFTVTNPTPGYTYQWDFGNTDASPGSASSPFVGQTAGANVRFAYPDPPLTAGEQQAASLLGCAADPSISGCERTAVYVVRVQAVGPTGAVAATSAPQNVVVVPVQPPVASLKVLRSGSSTDVTQPVTVVPQASVTQIGNSQDSVTSEEFWFNAGAAPCSTVDGVQKCAFSSTATLGPPSLVCEPDGRCGTPVSGIFQGHPYSGLDPIPGQTDHGTGTLNESGQPASNCAGGRRTGVPCETPTGGYESFSMNFWNRQLADIGSPGGIPTLPQEEFDNGTGTIPALTIGYPPLSTITPTFLEHDVDGLNGEQGSLGGCFPGYPFDLTTGGNALANSPFAYAGCDAYVGEGYETQNPELYPPHSQATGLALPNPDPSASTAVQFGPGDLAGYGPNSAEQLEDQFNFLYNYATVVGVDTGLDNQYGPATGATKGANGATVPRTITMVALNGEGVASAPVTENVPLTPPSKPSLQLCLTPAGDTGCVKPKGPQDPLVAGSQVTVNVSGSTGGTDSLAYYAMQVGEPNNTEVGDLKLGDGQTEQISGGACDPPGVSDRSAHDRSVNSGGVTLPFPIPVFSDLEAGAFPYHDCNAYAQRTVDSVNPGSDAVIPPPPSSGPNKVDQIVSSDRSARLRSANGPAQGGNVPVEITQASGSSSQPSQPLQFKFTQQGVYSVAVAAYNQAGLGAITRIDGMVVVKPSAQSLCTSVNSRSVVLSGDALGFSGRCMIVGDNNKLFASTEPIDIDGVPLTPPAGRTIVIDETHAGDDKVYVAKKCAIKTSDLGSVSSIRQQCPEPATGKAGTVYLGLGGGKNVPGLADVSDFGAKRAAEYLTMNGHADPQLPPLPQLNGKFNPGATIPCAAGAEPWTLTKSSEFQQFAVVGSLCVTFTEGGKPKSTGDSRISFVDKLPDGFGQGKATPTSPILLQGMDKPVVSLLDENAYANVARDQHPERIVDGGPVPAHAAQDDGSGDDSTCGGDDDDGLGLPTGTSLAGLGLPLDAQVCYDPSTGIFHGTYSFSVPPPLAVSVTIHLEIGHGRLLGAGGSLYADPGIPVIAGVGDLNGISFNIDTDPTVISGGIQLSLLDLLSIDGNLLLKPSNDEVDISGALGIEGTGDNFANFALDISKKGLELAGGIHESFGPASVSVNLGGGVDYSPSGWYIAGSGNLCIFICLSAQGVADQNAVAVCGSIDLLVGTLSAGAAVVWSGLPTEGTGLHLFTGCNLNPFIPAFEQDQVQGIFNGSAAGGSGSSNSPPGSSSARATYPRPPAQPVLSVGQSVPVTDPENPNKQLAPAGTCLPSSPALPAAGTPAGCTRNVAAVQVQSLFDPQAPGQTPLVTLTGPNGQQVVTPTIPGEYGFFPQAGLGAQSAGTGGVTDEGEAMVAQDPVPTIATDPTSTACPQSAHLLPANFSAGCQQVTTTTLFVADPDAGQWKLTVDPGSPPVVDVETADQLPPVSAPSLLPSGAAQQVHLVKRSRGYGVRIGGRLFSPTAHLLLAPAASHVSLSARAAASVPTVRVATSSLNVPGIDLDQLKGLIVHVPRNLPGSVTLLDVGPQDTQVLSTGLTAATTPTSGAPVLYDPSADPGRHTIEAFISDSAGIPSEEIPLTTYTATVPPAPKAPKVVGVKRSGGTITVTFRPGNAPIVNGIDVTVTGGGGEKIVAIYTPKMLHAIGRKSGVGAATQAREYSLNITSIPAGQKATITLQGSNDGTLGGIAKHFVGALVVHHSHPRTRRRRR